jgi:hypothetical protein
LPIVCAPKFSLLIYNCEKINNYLFIILTSGDLWLFKEKISCAKEQRKDTTVVRVKEMALFPSLARPVEAARGRAIFKTSLALNQFVQHAREMVT